MNDYKKINRKLQVFEVENGIILPQQKIEKDYPMWGLGGVCDKNNKFCNESFYDGGWATHGGKYEWSGEDYIDDEVVYVGMFYLHWGHFLIDLTNRMWCLPNLSKMNPDIKVAYLGEEEPKGNNLRFFELLGIKENQLIHIQKPTRFRKIFLPEQSFKPNTWYSDEFVLMFNELFDKVINSEYDFSRVKDCDKVYFTRRSFGKAVAS